MAKATNPVSSSENSRNALIAAEIVALINARPTCPSQEAIAAIIGRVPLAQVMDDPLVREVIAAIDGVVAAYENFPDDDDPKIAAARADFEAVAQRTWAREPKTLGDIAAHAVIAEALNGNVDGETGELLDLNPAALIANGRPAVCDDMRPGALALRDPPGARRAQISGRALRMTLEELLEQLRADGHRRMPRSARDG
jgi:hypothetical protein